MINSDKIHLLQSSKTMDKHNVTQIITLYHVEVGGEVWVDNANNSPSNTVSPKSGIRGMGLKSYPKGAYAVGVGQSVSAVQNNTLHVNKSECFVDKKGAIKYFDKLKLKIQ